MQQEPNKSNKRPVQRPVPRAQTRVQDFIWALVRVGELGCEEKQRRYLCRRQLSGAAALLHVRRILFACLNKMQKCRFINRKCPGPDSSDDVICSSCQRICGRGVAEGGEVCGDGLAAGAGCSPGQRLRVDFAFWCYKSDERKLCLYIGDY